MWNWLFALLFWLIAVTLQVQVLDPSYEARRLAAPAGDDFVLSPGPEILQLVAMEHRLGVADVVWLDVVQEVGKQEPAWDRIARWGEIGTDLDPDYFTIYHSAGIVLSVYGHLVDEADALFLKGWARLRDRWELPMMLGYDAYFIRGDAITASEFMQDAAYVPNSPRYLAALSGRMRFQAGDRVGAIAMLEGMLSFMEGAAKDDVEERLKLLKSEAILEAYDQACKLYRQQTGTVPTPKLLYEQGWVTVPPIDLLGAPVTLADDCIAHTENARVREFEAAEQRIGSGLNDPTRPDLKITPHEPEQ